MHLKGRALVAFAVLGLSPLAGAPAYAQSATAQESVDVSRLPLNLQRIQRELQQSAERADHQGLVIRYQVDVYGRSPEIVWFTKDDNLTNGPVPYGAPTHKEMIEAITPIEYRAPVADFTAIMRWLAEKAKK